MVPNSAAPPVSEDSVEAQPNRNETDKEITQHPKTRSMKPIDIWKALTFSPKDGSSGLQIYTIGFSVMADAISSTVSSTLSYIQKFVSRQPVASIALALTIIMAVTVSLTPNILFRYGYPLFTKTGMNLYNPSPVFGIASKVTHCGRGLNHSDKLPVVSRHGQFGQLY